MSARRPRGGRKRTHRNPRKTSARAEQYYLPHAAELVQWRRGETCGETLFAQRISSVCDTRKYVLECLRHRCGGINPRLRECVHLKTWSELTTRPVENVGAPTKNLECRSLLPLFGRKYSPDPIGGKRGGNCKSRRDRPYFMCKHFVSSLPLLDLYA
jgi:hypothetical protein